MIDLELSPTFVSFFLMSFFSLRESTFSTFSKLDFSSLCQSYLSVMTYSTTPSFKWHELTHYDSFKSSARQINENSTLE